MADTDTSSTYTIILEEAKKEFSLRGYYGTNVDRIAESAGVGKGTVYRHFKDKENLFHETLKYIAEESQSKILSVQITGDLKTDLNAMMDIIISSAYDNVHLLRNIFHFYSKEIEKDKERTHEDLIHSNKKNMAKHMVAFEKHHSKNVQFTEAIILKSMEKEKYSINIPTYEASNIIWRYYGGIFRDIIVFDKSKEEILQNAKHFVNIFIKGVKHA